MTLDYTPDQPQPTDVDALRYWTQAELNRLSQVVAEANEEFLSQIAAWTYLPIKGLMCRLEGQGASNPLVRPDSYNTGAVTRQGVGLYRIEILQDTVLGQDIGTVAYPNLQAYAPGASQYEAVRFIPGAPTGFIDIQMSEFYLQGQNLRVQPYDLQSGEFIWVTMLLNVTVDGVPTIPAAL